MKKLALSLMIISLAMGSALFSGCAGKSSAPAKLDTQADLWAEMDNLKAQMRKLNAEIEEMSYQMKSTDVGPDGTSLPQLADRVSRLESNMTQMASQLAVDLETPAMAAQPQVQPDAAYQPQAAYPVQEPTYAESQNVPAMTPSTSTTAPPVVYQPQPQPPVQSGEIPPPVIAAPRDPADALYTRALQSFNAKQYQNALDSWSDFIKSYPSNALTANSMFWRGECYYQLNDFANAVLAYQDVIEKFPKSSKYPDALFKRGAAFLKLGNTRAAKLSLQEVIDKYPDSTYAKRAKAILPK